MKKTLLKLLTLVSVTLPTFVYAQTGGFNTLSGIISQIAGIIQKLIPLVFGLAILAFFWGLVKYIFAQGSEDAKVDGRKIMLWAMVALFIMASVFGIIKLAQNTFDINDNTPIQPPIINIQR